MPLASVEPLRQQHGQKLVLPLVDTGKKKHLSASLGSDGRMLFSKKGKPEERHCGQMMNSSLRHSMGHPSEDSMKQLDGSKV